MELRKLEKEYFVHVYETGPDGRINLHSLFNYMQDIASEHAEKLGFGRDDLMKRNHFWVLSRMYAEIYDLPVWKDTIIVRTWPNGTDKLFAVRNYEIRFPDGRMIASAASSWLIVDRTSKKIQRPDETLTRYNDDKQDFASSIRNPQKLPEMTGNNIKSDRIRVGINDLDINLHTNNVNYLKWIGDTYDLNFVLNNLPCSAEINYLAESVFDDEILIRSSREEGSNNIYSHSILRITDNKEICRIRLKWKQHD